MRRLDSDAPTTDMAPRLASEGSASAYERLGGEVGLRAIIEDLYERLWGDIMVGFFFHPHDKATLVESQLRFMERALGGPSRYEGRPIRVAHASLPIRAGHFWRRHRILADTLRDHGADEEAAAAWLALDEKLMAAVVSC